MASKIELMEMAVVLCLNNIITHKQQDKLLKKIEQLTTKEELENEILSRPKGQGILKKMENEQKFIQENLKRIEKIMPKRKRGTPVFQATELGFACPICRCEIYPKFTFSEFDCFMWCERCKLDIPSCFCKIYYEPKLSEEELPLRDRIILQTKIFIDTLTKLQEGGNSSQP